MNGTRICTVPDCEGSSRSAGLCAKHYQRKRRGKPLSQGRMTREQYFIRHLQRGAGCWLWNGKLSPSGYGYYAQEAAHRVAYRLWVAPIPTGSVIDHLCMVKRCVNPSHLEAVSQRVNNLRADAAYGIRSAKTHCPAGHAYDAKNTYTSKEGRRACRTCGRDRARARALRKREASTRL